MPSHQASVVIQRPVSEVFEYMNDVSKEREWQPQLLEAEQIPPGPTAVGTKRRYVSEFLGKRLQNTYVVRAYDVDRRLVLESTPDSVIRATTEFLWEAEDGGTKVSMMLDGKASGVLRFVPTSLIEATFEKEVRETLRRLKECLEG